MLCLQARRVPIFDFRCRFSTRNDYFVTQLQDTCPVAASMLSTFNALHMHYACIMDVAEINLKFLGIENQSETGIPRHPRYVCIFVGSNDSLIFSHNASMLIAAHERKKEENPVKSVHALSDNTKLCFIHSHSICD